MASIEGAAGVRIAELRVEEAKVAGASAAHVAKTNARSQERVAKTNAKSARHTANSTKHVAWTRALVTAMPATLTVAAGVYAVVAGLL